MGIDIEIWTRRPVKNGEIYKNGISRYICVYKIVRKSMTFKVPLEWGPVAA